MSRCRTRAWLAGTVLLATPSPASPQTAELWFPTGASEFVEPADLSERMTPLIERAAYDRLAAGRRANPAFVPVREAPTLSPRARYGDNFLVHDQNRGFVVDGDAASGFVLYPDVNGNGTLVDDPPIRLSRIGDSFTALVTVPAGQGSTAKDPVQVRFAVQPMTTEPGDGVRGAAWAASTRTGVMHLDGRAIAFRLSGVGGSYDRGTNAVWVDVNGDGQSSDAETLQVRDRRFTVLGASYEFRVDPFGAGLGVRRLPGAAIERGSLAPGGVAPDFTVVDIDGRQHRLSDYRGKVVLLYFWASWCAPCQAEAPLLKAAVASHQMDLVVLGFSSDAPALIRTSAAKFGHAWAEVSEPMDGPVTTLYRVNGLPMHYVIDRGGRIALEHEGGIDGTDFLEQFEQQF